MIHDLEDLDDVANSWRRACLENEEQLAALTAERDALKADVQHLLDTCVPVAELDDLKAQLAAGDAARAALRDALEWIASQTNLFFAECSQAEEIIARAKAALASSDRP